jgi:hypothetical protein
MSVHSSELIFSSVAQNDGESLYKGQPIVALAYSLRNSEFMGVGALDVSYEEKPSCELNFMNSMTNALQNRAKSFLSEKGEPQMYFRVCLLIPGADRQHLLYVSAGTCPEREDCWDNTMREVDIMGRTALRKGKAVDRAPLYFWTNYPFYEQDILNRVLEGEELQGLVQRVTVS